MTTRKELVDRAIAFARPERIPIVFWNADHAEGDVMPYHLTLPRQGVEGASVNPWGQWVCEAEGGLVSQNEWGYRLESLDGTMGHPTQPALGDWDAAESLTAPPLREDERMAALEDYRQAAGDRYRLASLDLSGFTVYTLLRGFENSMVDFLLERERAERLLDCILDFECDLVRMVARRGFHGIHFADDWGTQQGLVISPRLWRELFKPRYRRQFDLAHALGLHVWFHCCGNFLEIAEDLHTAGVDVLNIAQPNVMDTAEVGRRLRGRQAFLVPISYQTVSLCGTVEEIHAEARRLADHLATPNGGLVGYVEQYRVLGMSPESYRACAEAWRRLAWPEVRER